MEIWYFLQIPRKDDLSKKSHWNTIFLVLSGKMKFFFRKILYFFFGRKMKDDLSQEIHGNIIFSVCMYKCYNYDITLLQKESKMIFSWKNRLIDILDRILERVPTILCTFMETFISVFIYCFPVKKPRKYRIEIWLLLQFICLEIFYNEQFSILYTIQPSGVVFRGLLERQLRKLFVH